jgi:hypothetical protein
VVRRGDSGGRGIRRLRPRSASVTSGVGCEWGFDIENNASDRTLIRTSEEVSKNSQISSV